jgi:hypothetical protein
MIHPRYNEIDGSAAPYFKSLESVFEIGLAFRAKVEESEEKRSQRRLLAAYALHEVGEEMPLFCSCLTAFLLGMDDTSFLLEILKGAGIVIHTKQMKKMGWKQQLIEKLLFRIHKPYVYSFLMDLVKESSARLHERIVRNFGSVQGFIDQLGDESKMEFYQWLKEKGNDTPNNRTWGRALNKVSLYHACLMIGNVPDQLTLQASFDNLDWAVYESDVLQGSYFVKGSKEYKEGSSSGLSFMEALRQAKEYEEKYEFEKIVTEDLHEKLEQINQTAEQQLSEALLRIDDLENEIHMLWTTIHEQDELLRETSQRNAMRPWLNGKRVLVIGHPVQEEMYEEEIVKRGGHFAFFPAVDDGINIHLLSGAIKRADVIYYITTYTSHKVDKYLRANVSANQLTYLTCKGRSSFTRELDATNKTSL